MTTITPCLWFDSRLAEAVEFYGSVFGDLVIHDQMHYPDGAGMPAGTLLTATFSVAGSRIMGLNAGPHDHFNDAVSMFVSCSGQAEVDALWDALLADGGSPSQCGWLHDKFGLRWQIVPDELGPLMAQPDPAAGARVNAALMGMTKIDLEGLRAAAKGDVG